MKIGIASDHNGVKIKENIKSYLENLGYNIIDYGPETLESVDYPEYAFKVGKHLQNKEIELGILICGTGIGMSIAANKVNKVRCALVHTTKEAKLARLHNNANCLALGSNLSMFKIKGILNTFINNDFSNIERHQRRVDMIDNYHDC